MNVVITITDPETGNYYGFDFTSNEADIFKLANDMKSDLHIEDSDCYHIECKVNQ